MSSSPNAHRPAGLSRKMIGAGVLAGAAIGAVATARARGITVPREQPTTIADWQRAAQIATGMNRSDALSAAERRQLDIEYRALVEQCLPLVSAYMGISIENPVERTFAFDRIDWINANIEAFQNLLGPRNEILLEPGRSQSLLAATLGTVNRQVVTAELGMLLGYLARRVLGQYDLALISGETEGPGNLYFVEPNIRSTESMLKLPADEFRLWLALHEITHVFQFEGFSWVKPYFRSLLDEYFVFLKSDIGELKNGVRAVRIFVDRLREGQRENQSWIESLMTPEQRSVFNRIQALMSIIEGYSNHVMNAVGKELMPHYDRIAKRFEQRQKNRGWGEQLLARMTGLDVKLEQYRLGETFIDAVVAVRGHEMALRVWDGPESLPSMAELDEPSRWIARMDATLLSAGNVAAR
ncbi:MAG: zinc-dependent metalloprotease [Chloroflexota bacterium]|nr:zinc-dependent metalloprotease [Chloroflexota bacterium]